MDEREARRLVETLFETWYPTLFRYAWRQSRNFAVAEDAVQEAFVELYRQLAQGRRIRHPKAWMLCVTRRQLQRRRCGAPWEAGPEPLEAADTARAVWENPERGLAWQEILELFPGLTPREEEVLWLRLEAMKYREIGRQLGISANSVATLLARALRKLRAGVKQDSSGARQDVDRHGTRTRKTLQ